MKNYKLLKIRRKLDKLDKDCIAISAIPKWVPHIETSDDYPLSMLSSKSRARTHSIHGNQDKLNRVDPDDVWVHPEDAAMRGVLDGQPVRVESAYGSTILPVRVTKDIARGCVSMKEGRWYTPDAYGVDREGCANSVTRDFSSACGATTYNTAFVEVRPVNPGPV